MSIDIEEVKLGANRQVLSNTGKGDFIFCYDRNIIDKALEQQQESINAMDEVIREMVTQLWKRDFSHRELKLNEQPRSIQSACELLNIKGES